jgi:hypothetical protein
MSSPSSLSIAECRELCWASDPAHLRLTQNGRLAGTGRRVFAGRSALRKELHRRAGGAAGARARAELVKQRKAGSTAPFKAPAKSVAHKLKQAEPRIQSHKLKQAEITRALELAAVSRQEAQRKAEELKQVRKPLVVPKAMDLAAAMRKLGGAPPAAAPVVVPRRPAESVHDRFGIVF